MSPVSPTISLFLVELEKSADALQDYGVLVGKVAIVLSVPCTPSVIKVGHRCQSVNGWGGGSTFLCSFCSGQLQERHGSNILRRRKGAHSFPVQVGCEHIM